MRHQRFANRKEVFVIDREVIDQVILIGLMVGLRLDTKMTFAKKKKRFSNSIQELDALKLLRKHYHKVKKQIKIFL